MAGQFDTLYGATDEEIKKQQKPLIQRKLKRVFEEALDKAKGSAISMESEIDTVRRNFSGFNIDSINRILDAKAHEAAAKRTQEAIKAEYKAMFGEDME